MAKKIIKMKNWSIINLGDIQVLNGDVIDHPILGSDRIVTSAILDVNKEFNLVETRNTIYQLITNEKEN